MGRIGRKRRKKEGETFCSARGFQQARACRFSTVWKFTGSLSSFRAESTFASDIHNRPSTSLCSYRLPARPPPRFGSMYGALAFSLKAPVSLATRVVFTTQRAQSAADIAPCCISRNYCFNFVIFYASIVFY